ncbi:helix-turn-helix domain-containing protein [Streptomyces canus]|uniref:helix-turn-helix domain-containing protein n=1 Tax=Streptomyces canus TaxID=58343 RepID=UPI003699A18A
MLSAVLAERRWNKTQLARRSGLARTTISRVFSGQTVPSSNTLERLLAALRPDRDQVVKIRALFEAVQDLQPPSAGSPTLKEQLQEAKDRVKAAEERAAQLEQLFRDQLARRDTQNVDDTEGQTPVDAAVTSDLLDLGSHVEFAPAASQVVEGLDRLFQLLGPPPQGLLDDVEPQLRGGGGSQR